jgi:hypothetical protein
LVGDFIFNLDSGESNWRGVGRTTVSRVGNYSKPRVLKESATSGRCPIPSSPTNGTRRGGMSSALLWSVENRRAPAYGRQGVLSRRARRDHEPRLEAITSDWRVMW